MLYLVVFSLYFGLSTVYLTGLITHFIRKSKGMQRKIFVYHFGALAFLCICGFLDMVNLLLQKYILDPVVSFTMFGVMGFGFILLYAFTSRLLQLIKQNKELLETFTIAYEDLRQAKALIALGKSTSLINHEIRNYLFTISFQTERVLSDPDISETSREACKKVVFAIKNLLHLNHDLLDQTRRNITSQHPPFNYVHSLQSCIDTHFASRKISFDCDFSAKDQYIYGDEERFREAIRSLLSYSLKCNATTITIKSMQDAFAILMVIEDNSPVSPHIDYTGIHLEHQPFDANERLEISIATTAIEAIGGHLTMVAKNKGTVGESGLLSYLSFPNYTAYPWKLDTEKDNVILVKEGLPKLESIVEMFHHVFVHPHVVEKAEQISYQFPSYIPVLGTRESLQPLIDNNSTSGLYFLELDKVDLLQVTDRTARTVPFTEYFILYDLLKLNRTVPEAVMRV